MTEEEKKMRDEVAELLSRPITEHDLKHANLVIEGAREAFTGKYLEECEEFLEKCKSRDAKFPMEIIGVSSALLNFKELNAVIEALKEMLMAKALEEVKKVIREGTESDDPEKQKEALKLAAIIASKMCVKSDK